MVTHFLCADKECTTGGKYYVYLSTRREKITHDPFTLTSDLSKAGGTQIPTAMKNSWGVRFRSSWFHPIVDIDEYVWYTEEEFRLSGCTQMAPGDMSMTISNLPSGTRYEFAIRVISGQGSKAAFSTGTLGTDADSDVFGSMWSYPLVRAGTLDATAPGPPRTLDSKQPTCHNESAVIQYKAPSEDGGSPITHYVVRFRSPGGAVWRPAPLKTQNPYEMKFSSSTTNWEYQHFHLSGTSIEDAQETATAQYQSRIAGLATATRYSFEIAAATKEGLGSFLPLGSCSTAGLAGAQPVTWLKADGQSWNTVRIHFWSILNMDLASIVVQYRPTGTFEPWSTFAVGQQTPWYDTKKAANYNRMMACQTPASSRCRYHAVVPHLSSNTEYEFRAAAGTDTRLSTKYGASAVYTPRVTIPGYGEMDAGWLQGQMVTDVKNTGHWSRYAVLTTIGSPGSETPPTNVKAANTTASSVTLTWDAPAGASVLQYVIFYRACGATDRLSGQWNPFYTGLDKTDPTTATIF
jgi:hypothetical protein